MTPPVMSSNAAAAPGESAVRSGRGTSTSERRSGSAAARAPRREEMSRGSSARPPLRSSLESCAHARASAGGGGVGGGQHQTQCPAAPQLAQWGVRCPRSPRSHPSEPATPPKTPLQAPPVIPRPHTPTSTRTHPHPHAHTPPQSLTHTHTCGPAHLQQVAAAVLAEQPHVLVVVVPESRVHQPQHRVLGGAVQRDDDVVPAGARAGWEGRGRGW